MQRQNSQSPWFPLPRAFGNTLPNRTQPYVFFIENGSHTHTNNRQKKNSEISTNDREHCEEPDNKIQHTNKTMSKQVTACYGK